MVIHLMTGLSETLCENLGLMSFSPLQVSCNKCKHLIENILSEKEPQENNNPQNNT